MRRKLRVLIASTGDELRDPGSAEVGTDSGAHLVADANRQTLKDLLLGGGSGGAVPTEVHDLGILSDSQEVVFGALARAAVPEQLDDSSDAGSSGTSPFDLIVLSGAASTGSKDFVRPAIAALGTVVFDQVNVKPGKPTLFGMLDVAKCRKYLLNNNVQTSRSSVHDLFPGGRKLIPIFGLPGNPCSCFVTGRLFVWPALERLAGAGGSGTESNMDLAAVLTKKIVTLSDIQPDPVRPEYVRAWVYWGLVGGGMGGSSGGQLVAKATGFQRSSRVESLARVNALLYVPSSSQKVVAGTELDCMLFGAVEEAPASVAVGVPAPLLRGRVADCSAPIIPSLQDVRLLEEKAEAYAIQQVIKHFQTRTDIQNIDVMQTASFCRNCLSKWLFADSSKGDGGKKVYLRTSDLDGAREFVYGMSYSDWKKLYQTGPKISHEAAHKGLDGNFVKKGGGVGDGRVVATNPASPARKSKSPNKDKTNVGGGRSAEKSAPAIAQPPTTNGHHAPVPSANNSVVPTPCAGHCDDGPPPPGRGAPQEPSSDHVVDSSSGKWSLPISLLAGLYRRLTAWLDGQTCEESALKNVAGFDRADLRRWKEEKFTTLMAEMIRGEEEGGGRSAGAGKLGRMDAGKDSSLPWVRTVVRS